MPTLAWATDIHLDFVSPRAVTALGEELAASGPDGVVLSGDLSVAAELEEHLEELALVLERPIYFVLGNHDYYGSSIERVRGRMQELSARSRWLRWLQATGVIDLGGGWSLVGHDGWGDGRVGDFAGSEVMLTDWIQIEELAGLRRDERLARLRQLGDEAGAYFARTVPAALEHSGKLLVATHVPPFREACWHAGKRSTDDWLPWFSCIAAGEALHAAMSARPDARALVVCGHTHGGGTADILPNLHVRTGAADYGAPAAQPPLVLE